MSLLLWIIRSFFLSSSIRHSLSVHLYLSFSSCVLLFLSLSVFLCIIRSLSLSFFPSLSNDLPRGSSSLKCKEQILCVLSNAGGDSESSFTLLANVWSTTDRPTFLLRPFYATFIARRSLHKSPFCRWLFALKQQHNNNNSNSNTNTNNTNNILAFF